MDFTTEPEGAESPAAPNEITRKLIAWIKRDMTRVRKWRKTAKEDFRFYANDQWSDDDLQVLRDQRRPAMTFNRIAPLVNAVTGSEINNRREVRYFPREPGDAIGNELLSSAGEWFRDECNAEDEESDAFEDCVIAGMGWTDTRLDFERNPDGEPVIERLDPLEMGWDCDAVKPGLEDAKRLWRIRELTYDDAVDLTGEKDRAKLHAAWVNNLGDSPEPHDQDRADQYAGGQDDAASPYRSTKCLVVEIRWLEKQTFYRGPDTDNPGELREYDEKQVSLIRKAQPDFPVVRQRRNVVRRAFIGREVLGEPDTPMVPQGMFGWECMTGYRHKIDNQFYGVVRSAKDPQRWSNKFFSQVMYLLNSQSKGGIMAERSAFDDQREAESTWARADAITFLKDGALSSERPKVQPKPAGAFPNGFFALFQESKEAISDVTGLSKEFIGTREVEQAGVLEYQRRQSSLNLLASLFNSLRRYRKRQGRIMLFLIQEHLSDGRLVRIVGDDRKQYVPLMTRQALEAAKRQALEGAAAQGIPPEQAQALIQQQFGAIKAVDGTYDIVVDDSPSSPNEKDRTWQIIMQMLPLVRDLVTPEIALELLKWSPIPASIVENIKQVAAQQQQNQPPPPEAIKAQMEMQKHQMDMAGKQADLQARQAENQMDLQMKGVDLMIEQNRAEMDLAVDRQKLQNDMTRLAIQQRANEIAAQRANSQRVNAASK